MGFFDVSLLVISLFIGSIYFIQNYNLELTNLTLENIISSNIITNEFLLLFRLISFLIVVITLFIVINDSIGLKLAIPGRNGIIKHITLHGYERLSTFTVWSWILIGIYFGLTSYCGILSYFNYKHYISNNILIISWILYELSFAVSYLITIVVTFVLIPSAKSRNSHHVFFTTPSLLMHNANVILMTLDSLLNLLPYLYSHAVFGILYGLCYAIFSWIWFYYRGVFYYFFLDYEFKGAFFWYLGLCFVVFYLFYFILFIIIFNSFLIFIFYF